MELSEFLNRDQAEPEVEETTAEPEEIDVQKAVVESLAADKVEQDMVIADLRKRNEELLAANKKLQEDLKALREQTMPAQNEIKTLREQMQTMQTALANVGEVLAKNKEGELSSQVSLLDRGAELDDRFEGETRDHVIEVLREARDAAEKNGRFRRAQVLEAVLVNNEPSGELAKRREELTKLFTENANIINGTVIEELQKRGISHKNGENYLLPSEILARNY